MGKNSQDLLSRFKEHLEHKKFFKPGARILVACSGGPDSVALFHLMEKLSRANGWTLGLLHFNHQLRPRNAKRDEQFVRRLARKCRIPFFAGRGNVAFAAKKEKISLEECARQRRYDFFLQTARARKFPVIVLAHTLDDQAETVLMRVIQGTGLRGLEGIRECFKRDGVTLARPLLAFCKKELLEFLHAGKFRFCKDETNDSLRFLRNRIRLKLIPQLRRDFNPRVMEALSRIPAIVAEENALLSELEEAAWSKVFKKCTKKKLSLQRASFLKFPAPLQFRILERALKRLDPKSGLSFEAWEKLRRGLGRPAYRHSLPKDIDFSMTRKSVTLYRK